METKPTIALRQVRDVGDVLNVTFSFIRQEFKPLAKALLVIAGPAMILGSAAAGLMQTFSLFADPANDMGAGAVGLFFLSLLVATVAGLIGATLAITTAYGYLVLYQRRGTGSVPVAEVWQFTKANFFRMLGTLVFWYFAVMAAYIAALIPAILFLGGAAALMESGGGGAAIGGLLVLLFVVLALLAMAYAAITLGLMLPMRMFEREVGLFGALRRSFRLVRGYWWATFAIAVVVGIAYIAFSLMASIPVYAIIGIGTVAAADGGVNSGLLQLLMTVFGALGGLLGTVLYALPLYAIAFQYFNLVERKERTGLAERVEAVRAEASAAKADRGAAGWSSSVTETTPEPAYRSRTDSEERREALSAEAPSAEALSAEAPSAEAPSAEAPSAEAPSAEAPPSSESQPGDEPAPERYGNGERAASRYAPPRPDDSHDAS